MQEKGSEEAESQERGLSVGLEEALSLQLLVVMPEDLALWRSMCRRQAEGQVWTQWWC